MAKSLSDRLKSNTRSFKATGSAASELAKVATDPTGEYVVEQIPISKVYRDESQPRPINEVMAGIEEFADRLEAEKFNLINPISVFKFSDGTYRLIAGERRYTAFKLKGQETITAKVYPALSNEINRAVVWRIQYSENSDRKDLSCFATGAALVEGLALLFDGQIPSDEECRKHFGHSSRAIYSYIQSTKAPDDVKRFCEKAGVSDYKTVNALSAYRKKIESSDFEKFTTGYFGRGDNANIHVLDYLKGVKSISELAASTPEIEAVSPEKNSSVIADVEPKDLCKKEKSQDKEIVAPATKAEIVEAYKRLRAGMTRFNGVYKLLSATETIDPAAVDGALKLVHALEADLKDLRISIEDLRLEAQ